MLAVLIAAIGAAGVVLAALLAFLGVRITAGAARKSDERRLAAEAEARRQALDASESQRIAERRKADLDQERERAAQLAAEAERIAEYHERLHAAHAAELERAYSRIRQLEAE